MTIESICLAVIAITLLLTMKSCHYEDRRVQCIKETQSELCNRR